MQGLGQTKPRIKGENTAHYSRFARNGTRPVPYRDNWRVARLKATGLTL